MFAFTHTLLALPLPPAAVFTAVPVVRVILCPFPGMSDVPETTVVPTTAEVMVTVQLAVAASLVYVQDGEPPHSFPTRRSSDLAVCGPASSVPLSAFTVIVNT